MSLPLERWAREAIDLEYAGTPEKLVASPRVLDDIVDLAVFHKAQWRERQRRMDAEGFPQAMAQGVYGSLLALPNSGTWTTTSINGTANLYPQLTQAPIPTSGIMGPMGIELIMAGKITDSTSPGNIGFDPRIGATGAWTTGGTSLTTGLSLGASTNVALTASITNAFYYLKGTITIRAIGLPGTNTTAVGMFHVNSTQNTAGGLAGPAAAAAAMNLLFGGTAVSFDSSVASGIAMGAVHTVTTITHNVEQVHAVGWN